MIKKIYNKRLNISKERIYICINTYEIIFIFIVKIEHDKNLFLFISLSIFRNKIDYIQSIYTLSFIIILD